MKIRVASITRSRSGQPVRAERVVEADVVTLGRAAGSTLYLPDPRIALEHGRIVRGIDGDWLTLLKDGAGANRLRLTLGASIDIGPYALGIEEAPEDIDLALTIELARPLPEDATGRAVRTSLRQTWLTQRVPALLLFVLVLAVFVAVPLLNAFDPDSRAAFSKQPLTPDLAWNPGELAAPHHMLNRRCEACHERPFARVRDEACAACHKNVAGHAREAQLQHTLFGATRCATCHADHKGAMALAQPSSNDCVACHSNLKRRGTGTWEENVGDFARAHPEFKLTLWRGPGKKPHDFVRVARDDKRQLIERSGLTFPHDVHLKAGLQGPKGREKLACGDCHQSESSSPGDEFKPISMQSHCQRCHSLEFEPLLSTREAPHGDVERVVAAISAFYESAALNNLPVDAAPAAPLERGIGTGGAVNPAERARALAWARRKTRAVAKDLIEVRACPICHQVTHATDRSSWKVEPVVISQQWMPGARFDHASHAASPCGDCHKVEKSKRSEDVAMPNIATCRACHGGNQPVPNKLTSTCLTCHAFHAPGRQAMVADGKPVRVSGSTLPIQPIKRPAPEPTK
jgi:Cytochrome c7 and related cytochrome c